MAAKNQSSGIIRVFIWIYGRRVKSFLNFRTNSNIKECVCLSAVVARMQNFSGLNYTANEIK